VIQIVNLTAGADTNSDGMKVLAAIKLALDSGGHVTVSFANSNIFIC
jgi:hypothetical protein